MIVLLEELNSLPIYHQSLSLLGDYGLIYCVRRPGRLSARIRYISSHSQGKLPPKAVCMCYAFLICISQVNWVCWRNTLPLPKRGILDQAAVLCPWCLVSLSCVLGRFVTASIRYCNSLSQGTCDL